MSQHAGAAQTAAGRRLQPRCAARQATLLAALPRALNLEGVPGARRVL